MNSTKDSKPIDVKSNEELSRKIKKNKDTANKKTIAELWKEEHYKKRGTILLLSGLVGLVFLGVGYYYLERKFKGKIFLVIGISLMIVGGLSVIFSGIFESLYAFYVIFLILWAYQFRETVGMCKEWNEYISKGLAPW